MSVKRPADDWREISEGLIYRKVEISVRFTPPCSTEKAEKKTSRCRAGPVKKKSGIRRLVKLSRSDHINLLPALSQIQAPRCDFPLVCLSAPIFDPWRFRNMLGSRHMLFAFTGFNASLHVDTSKSSASIRTSPSLIPTPGTRSGRRNWIS